MTDRGGAGSAANKLHSSLLATGHGSQMLVADKFSKDSEIVSLVSRMSISRIYRLLTKCKLKLLTHSDFHFQKQSLSLVATQRLIQASCKFAPDVIVVHYVSHFISFQDIANISHATSAPVIWHLLDMAGITGGCHYAWNCRGYEGQCKACPAFRTRFGSASAAKEWQRKSRAIQSIQSTVVAGSSTLLKQSISSSLFRGLPHRLVLIGVQDDVPSKSKRLESRQHFGLPPDRPVLFFGAQLIDSRRKGVGLLIDSLRLIAKGIPREQLPHLLVAGNGASWGNPGHLGYDETRLGYVNGEVLRQAYAASDLFICPSIEDSGPMMINESVMAGTPVVAFEMGVAPDLIVPGVSGELATLGDTESLKNAINKALTWSTIDRDMVAKRCNQIGLERCSAKAQAESFSRIALELRK